MSRFVAIFGCPDFFTGLLVERDQVSLAGSDFDKLGGEDAMYQMLLNPALPKRGASIGMTYAALCD